MALALKILSTILLSFSAIVSIGSKIEIKDIQKWLLIFVFYGIPTIALWL